jgi:hypothetical protein
MNQRAASLYVRKGQAFVTSMSRTMAGFWIESEPLFVEDRADPLVIASCVRLALAASQVDVPTPSRDMLGSRLPALAGVKTYGAFMKGAVSVDISMDDGQIRLIPMRNGGTRKGFQFKNDEVLIVVDDKALADYLALALRSAD